ncbi:MAG TPA: alpha/beta hydrolase domain-containing protein [Myxococcales bacterium]|nr:alpha/beta hydrolase domain-containing protein [Myxococcales bacterium]
MKRCFALLLLTALPALAAAHTCPTDLTAWKQLLGAEWLDCHQVADLTTTNNPYTDPQSLTGMGFPPPGSGTLNSKYTQPTTPPVSGLQIDGWFPDACNAFQAEPALTAKDGTPFIPGCTPPPTPGQTCVADCHHDGQFVIRIPDDWDGHLLTTGTPGIRDAFSSDFIFSDYVLEKGWAYVSQDKGNMGANFFHSGADESGGGSTPWVPGAAVKEWTTRVRQATSAARALLNSLAPQYGLTGVTRSYVAGISNGGYQTRRALETDNKKPFLYDGGVDWEGTLFLSSLPAGVKTQAATTGFNLFTYLPTSLANYPGDVAGDPAAVQALAAVGFNPQSQPLWSYHWTIYWGLTQKIYRLEFDPEYTGYTCSDPLGAGPPCVSPPALTVPPGDPDASYDYRARLKANPALASRLDAVANTGNIQHPLITLHGDQDSLLPIATDSDLYSQMVALQHKSKSYRYYVVQGGNHVDPLYDDHAGIDSYGDTVLRPMLPCVRAAVDAVALWVEGGVQPPASHTIPRPQGATPDQLANVCSLQ